MKFTISQSEEGRPLALAGELDIYGADELREALESHVGKTSSIALDLSGVSACDPVAVQLICAARRTAAAAEKPFRIVQLSAPFALACTALGITSEQLALS
jgi:chemotaxis protein CheX